MIVVYFASLFGISCEFCSIFEEFKSYALRETFSVCILGEECGKFSRLGILPLKPLPMASLQSKGVGQK